MPKNHKYLSFHTNSALQHSTHGFSILHSSTGDFTNHATQMHAHDFWQLEFIIGGDCRFGLAQNSPLLSAGSYVLIPPSVEHAFTYDENTCRIMSTKFTWTQALAEDGQSIIGNIAPKSFVTYIEDLHVECSADSSLLPGFSTAMLAHILTIIPQLPAMGEGPTKLVAQVSEMIHSYQGQPVPIKALACDLGCSVNHLSARYAQEAGITLKQSIDNYRCEVAKQLLRYEEHSVSQIADILGFPDVFSFSRFFYRVTAVRPKKFRSKSL